MIIASFHHQFRQYPDSQLDFHQNGIPCIRIGIQISCLLAVFGKLQPIQLWLTAGKQILETYPDAKILFLTTFSDDEYIVRALRMGAKGYLLKQNFESILPALQAVQKGQTVFGEEITDKIPDLINKTTAQRDFAKYGITEKEYAIIEQVANGLNNKEIAETLYLSEGTVRNYLSSILEKLELRDRTQLAIFYYR